MKDQRLCRLLVSVTVACLLTFPGIVHAQFFNYDPQGDVLLGFRKTGQFQGNYELVVNLGNITNFFSVPSGSSLSISKFAPAQLSDAFPDGYQDLQWSVFSAFGGQSAWTNSVGIIPSATTWYTLPRTNSTVQTAPPLRLRSGNSASLRQQMLSAGQGANNISTGLGTTNSDNNTHLVREPISDTLNYLTAFIGDRTDPTFGDFGGAAIQYSVENTTPDSFTDPVVSDFYMSCPLNTADPVTGSKTGNATLVGNFSLSPGGVMTFTRGSTTSVTAPSVTTVAASSVTSTAAVLNASINPNGAATTFSFQYGTDTTYGSTTPVVTLASGTAAVSTNASIGGLLASTTYHFRVVATNSGGFATGGDMTFATPGNTPPPPPQLGSSAFGSNGFSFSFTSNPGTTFTAWGTTDISLPFNQWSNLGPVAVIGQGQYQFTDASSTNSGQRFYRVTQP